jgi:hypothetical protein
MKDQLEEAFKNVEIVDCLKITKSSAITDFLFLKNLKKVTGRTWNITVKTVTKPLNRNTQLQFRTTDCADYHTDTRLTITRK